MLGATSDEASGTGEMTGLLSLTDYIAVFDPRADEIGQAEFDARLAGLLDTDLEGLDARLLEIPQVRIARLLMAAEEPARALRRRLRLVAKQAAADALAEASVRVISEGGRPAVRLRAALLARACRTPVTEEERIVAEIREAREEIVALWPDAFDAVARWGSIDRSSAWSLGIGSVVWGMITSALGRHVDDRIAREEFVALCPRLVEFWPLTPASHEAMHALLAIVRAAASGEMRGSGPRLEAVN